MFRQFNDLETLARSVHERLLPEVLALSRAGPPTGDLAKDLRSLVARRARVFEHLAPFRRASRTHRERSPFMTDQDATMATMLRGSIEAVVRPHLGRGRRDLLEVIDVLLSVEAWDRLRTVQRLTAERAESVLQKGALALLTRADVVRWRRSRATGSDLLGPVKR